MVGGVRQWLEEDGSGWRVKAVVGGLWQWLEEDGSGWRSMAAVGGRMAQTSAGRVGELRPQVDAALTCIFLATLPGPLPTIATRLPLRLRFIRLRRPPVSSPFLHGCAQAEKENPLLAVTMRG